MQCVSQRPASNRHCLLSAAGTAGYCGMVDGGMVHRCRRYEDTSTSKPFTNDRRRPSYRTGRESTFWWIEFSLRALWWIEFSLRALWWISRIRSFWLRMPDYGQYF
jgi:hypothetical protein